MSALHPIARNLRDRRFQGLAAASVLVAATFLARPLPLTRDGLEVLAVLDITGSMNVRDYVSAEGRPTSRLETAKAALRDLVAAMPCGSRMALGLFTERRPFLLFTPIEVCGDFAPLDGALASLDWRMAWEGDSRVSAGLFRSVEMAASLGTDLVFVTDGQEAPPLPIGREPAFEGKPGAVRGLIVGAGAYGLSPIPRFDDRGRETGFYGAGDVQQENRFGPPPADAEGREGYNPRNAPFGSGAATGTEHLSSVREPYLKSLADRTGLAYAHLDGPSGLLDPLRAVATPRALPGSLDIRPFLGAAALLLLLAAFAEPRLGVLRLGLPRPGARPFFTLKKV
ncbi:vWA domain-containing protein [Methylobacterium sp. Leaf108]|uniref:vWA domain-containing protein n=1 Tax=Methylobacterium sp. Leaf108 TaxID=1736256 RepID=UPI0009EC046D|nr:vWA domain-containing protein [Methylobacterium sp. Leaf108]